MILPIDEQYRITADPYQWIVQRKRTRAGQEDWQSQTYHSTFESAARELWELMVRTSDAQTLVDALADVERITTTLSQALTPQSEWISAVIDRDQD